MNTTVTARKHSHQTPTTQRTFPIFKTPHPPERSEPTSSPILCRSSDGIDAGRDMWHRSAQTLSATA